MQQPVTRPRVPQERLDVRGQVDHGLAVAGPDLDQGALHGGDHVLPALVAPSLSVPVLGGRAALGTWQSVCLVDTNTDNPVRSVRLSFLPG